MATNPVTPPPEESSGSLQAADATAAHTLPGFLPWEDDLEMVSKYLDRKVNVCHSDSPSQSLHHVEGHFNSTFCFLARLTPIIYIIVIQWSEVFGLSQPAGCAFKTAQCSCRVAVYSSRPGTVNER